MIEQVAGYVVLYLMCGALVGAVTLFFVPSDFSSVEMVALTLTAGLLFPVSAPVLLYLVLRIAARAMSRGYRSLWRRWRHREVNNDTPRVKEGPYR